MNKVTVEASTDENITPHDDENDLSDPFKFQPMDMKLMRRSTMNLSSSKAKESGRLTGIDEKKMKLKSNIVFEIRNVQEEIDTSQDQLTDQSQEHIAENDLILTYSESGTVTKFLTEAAENHKFEVIVAETAPFFTGHKTAASLSKAGI